MQPGLCQTGKASHPGTGALAWWSNVCHQIIYLAIELSSSSWVIAYRLPANDKAKVHRLEADDGAGLLAFIASLRHRLDPSDDASTLVVSCFEAGRDGFWLHRLLSAHGVINHVVEPDQHIGDARRPARQSRSAGRFRPLTRPCGKSCWRSRRLQDRRRAYRERVRIENRIAALLATQGIRGRLSLRFWNADMNGRRPPAADPSRRRVEPLAPAAVADPRNDRELDAVREEALEAQHDSASRTVKALCTIRGIGVNFASVLTREVFYRTFDNRRQIASYLGLAPTPFQSGGMDRDRRINRAGNSRALVALARKLLIAIWRFVTLGLAPEGAIIAA